jgi:hypothetical protein
MAKQARVVTETIETQAPPVSSEITFSTTLGFTQAESEMEFHGTKVDISSITPAGLKYLIGLGFTTSLTQCNAGQATAMREEGIPKDESELRLKANREARLQKICDGTIAQRGGSGAPKRDLEAKLLADMAWSGIQIAYGRTGAKLPTAAGEKALAIARWLEAPGNRAKAQAQVTAMLSIA